MSPASFRLLPLAVALLLAGCASQPEHSRVIIYGTITLPADSGAAQLIPPGPAPVFSFAEPKSPFTGAQTGALAFVDILTTPEEKLAVPFGLPYMMLGATAGALRGLDGVDAQAGAARILATSECIHLHETIGRALATHLRPTQPGGDEAWLQVKLLFQGLRIRDKVAPPIVAVPRARDTTQSARTRSPPPDMPFASVNPPVSVVFILGIAADRAADGKSLGSISVQYESVPRMFSEWAEDDARLIRREFELAQQDLLEALFVNATRARPPAASPARE
jgi:hypothetical protein